TSQGRLSAGTATVLVCWTESVGASQQLSSGRCSGSARLSDGTPGATLRQSSTSVRNRLPKEQVSTTAIPTERKNKTATEQPTRTPRPQERQNSATPDAASVLTSHLPGQTPVQNGLKTERRPFWPLMEK